MPLTPYHLGPSSWIGQSSSRIFDFTTLLVSSVVPDIEPLVVIAFNLSYPTHGFFHSFLGGTALALLTAMLMYLSRHRIGSITTTLRLPHSSSFRVILWTSFFGVYSHILLDSFSHTTMKPFYPLMNNPLLGIFSEYQVKLFCGFGFSLAIFLYFIRLAILRRKS
jgi:membrane-bound metal-dependent hydrolase YbcI (DUF457 family)